jgi:hypothetical protein
MQLKDIPEGARNNVFDYMHHEHVSFIMTGTKKRNMWASEPEHDTLVDAAHTLLTYISHA